VYRTKKLKKWQRPNSGTVETLIVTIFLRVVLYGFEASSLTLREELGPKVYENRVLRRICIWAEEK
jgi:hypothetical protein